MKFEDYSKSFIFFHDENAPELLTRYLPTKSFSVADLGAGDGVLLVALQRAGYLNKANNIVAVEISEERCGRLRKCSDIKVICEDVTCVPGIEGDSFDCIINTQVIEHVDEKMLLSEIKRIIKNEGILYIASLVNKKGNDKNYMFKYGWRYGWRFYKKNHGKWFLDPTHLREYESKEKFVDVIQAAGFDVIDSKLTPLKLSLLEFIIRRIITPVFKLRNINSFFFKHKILDSIRRNIKIQPPGYYLVEVVAKKSSQVEVAPEI